ncbi:SDR family oxidoreductase [Parvicella tangerina]|uniref:Oxidoreductase SadH n=1 Tax=Parvicella tangerina TaxID=2829795 RepID=A0A916N8K7_9FLAO|nr:SDR family oxidoreductase [Parvicella tangerina]CAG5077216.1 Putative oxidoreductase SadH [Parvicella tangerina]
MESLNEKVVWITGASSGIGEAAAMAFSNHGAKVILSSRRADQLKQVASRCKGDSYVLPLDLSDNSNFSDIVKEAIEAFGQVDVLLNNGGISQRSEAAETPIEVDRKVMEVNYFGNISLTKALLPHFQERQQGRIVVISSLSGKFGFFLRSAYAASKFALVGFYESLRLEEEKNNIRVHLVYPGFIKTNISKNAIDANGNTHGEMDNNQNKGISAQECATRLIRGIQKDKKDIFIGGKEMMSLKIQRFFPNLFHSIIKKQSAT